MSRDHVFTVDEGHEISPGWGALHRAWQLNNSITSLAVATTYIHIVGE
jgi:hypothetical protein